MTAVPFAQVSIDQKTSFFLLRFFSHFQCVTDFIQPTPVPRTVDLIKEAVFQNEFKGPNLPTTFVEYELGTKAEQSKSYVI